MALAYLFVLFIVLAGFVVQGCIFKNMDMPGVYFAISPALGNIAYTPYSWERFSVNMCGNFTCGTVSDCSACEKASPTAQSYCAARTTFSPPLLTSTGVDGGFTYEMYDGEICANREGFHRKTTVEVHCHQQAYSLSSLSEVNTCEYKIRLNVPGACLIGTPVVESVEPKNGIVSLSWNVDSPNVDEIRIDYAVDEGHLNWVIGTQHYAVNIGIQDVIVMHGVRYAFRLAAFRNNTLSGYQLDEVYSDITYGRDKCGDSVCDWVNENCFNCPTDCWCKKSGWAVYVYALATGAAIGTPYVSDQLGCPAQRICVYKTSIYLKRENDESETFAKYVSLKVDGGGAYMDTKIDMYIDNNMVAGGMVNQAEYDFWYNFAPLQFNRQAYYIRVEVYNWKASGVALTLAWGDAVNNVATILGHYYRSDECGNSICEANEARLNCGDCGAHQCTATFPQGHILASYISDTDTLGTIVANQMLRKLPGVDHLSHGFDVITGEELAPSLFRFTYCDTNISQTIYDSYRGNLYQLPGQLDGDAFPECSFSMETSHYKSTTDYAAELSGRTGVSGSISGAVWGATATVSFSQESSVKSSNSIHDSKSASLSVTETKCLTSRVQIKPYNVLFNPEFVRDVQQVTNPDELRPIFKQYGTHYYQWASLGGKLSISTSTAASTVASMSSQEFTSAIQASVKAGFNGRFVKVNGKASYGSESSLSAESQAAVEQASTQSSITVYGGSPGAFGPDATDRDWTQWAQSVDLLPVPVEYKLDRIYNIMLKSNKFSPSLLSMWAKAEKDYFLEHIIDSEGNMHEGVINTYILEFAFNGHYSDHRIEIRLYDPIYQTEMNIHNFLTPHIHDKIYGSDHCHFFFSTVDLGKDIPQFKFINILGSSSAAVARIIDVNRATEWKASYTPSQQVLVTWDQNYNVRTCRLVFTYSAKQVDAPFSVNEVKFRWQLYGSLNTASQLGTLYWSASEPTHTFVIAKTDLPQLGRLIKLVITPQEAAQNARIYFSALRITLKDGVQPVLVYGSDTSFYPAQISNTFAMINSTGMMPASFALYPIHKHA